MVNDINESSYKLYKGLRDIIEKDYSKEDNISIEVKLAQKRIVDDYDAKYSDFYERWKKERK